MATKPAKTDPGSGHWLFKTEPGDYSYARLEREGRATWDGVANPVALRHLSQVRKGDRVFVYHTGDEKAVVGVARAVSDAYPDGKDPRAWVVDLEPVEPLPRPVSLATVKADPRFAGFPLVRQGRLSVMPVPPDLWSAILDLAL